MHRLFISHSSRDNAHARALFQWLESEGYKGGVFLDIDEKSLQRDLIFPAHFPAFLMPALGQLLCRLCAST